MALVEQQRKIGGSLGVMMLARVLPHSAAMCYVGYFLSGQVSTVRTSLPLFFAVYAAATAAHTWAAARRFRFPVVAAATAAAAFLAFATAAFLHGHSEAGAFTAKVTAVFLSFVLAYSCVVNYWFTASRIWYLVDSALTVLIWIVMVLGASEFTIPEAALLTLPVAAYVFYTLLFDYIFRKPYNPHERRMLAARFVFVIAALLIALFGGVIARLTGEGGAATAGEYSLLSRKNNRFHMQDRARLEDRFKLPLDSKELVFVAHIPYADFEGIPIGASYLKFHSLYNYDPLGSEFNTAADETEAPDFRMRSIPLDQTIEEAAAITVDLEGRAVLPPYRLRFEGRSTIYNIRLAVDRSFGHNVTYRILSYTPRDSVSVAGENLPVLGVHKLFSRVSILNVIPMGTAGRFFQFDLNSALLDRIGEYPDLQSAPPSFTQRYLNTGGLEDEIVDTMRALLASRVTVREKVQTVIDFFTQRDAGGRPLFAYSLNPGKSPDPGESLLKYFLLKSRRGYCTYYATAAALFFRAAGIPSRVAIGFVPGEQNDNLPGWYYVYSNQAHAWTEIYLGPSLGWIDVDLTPEGESPGGPPPPPPTPPAPPDPLGTHYKLAGIVTEEGDSLSVSRAVLVEHAEERDSILRVFPERREIRLDFDVSVEERKGVSRERKLATAVARSLAEGDSVIATGRISSNSRGLSDTCSEFIFHKLTLAQRTADNRHADAGTGDSVSTRRKLVIASVAAVILALLTAAALPSVSLFLLARRIHLTRRDEIRLQATRDWILLSLHMQGISAGRETDLEFIDRAEKVTGARMRSFINAWLEYRYTGKAPAGSSELCAPLVRGLWSALRNMRGTAGAVIRLANTWEYLRCINRRKTA